MHERTALRKAVVDTLKGPAPAFATAARDRVKTSRLAPARVAELPAIHVYIAQEEITVSAEGTRELERKANLVVEGWVALTADSEAVEDALDDLSLEIETALDRNLYLGDTVFSCTPTTVEVGLKVDGDRPMGCVHMEFDAIFHTDLRVLAPVDDFKVANVDHDTAGQTSTDVVQVQP